MPTCQIEGCDRDTFHDDPPLCLQHTIEADPNARIEVSLVDLVAAEDAAPAAEDVPPKRRQSTSS